jgi:four helix bundle protein
MRDFRTLIVWQKAHRLALEVHRAAQGIGPRTRSGLANQMSRAAASIPANVAEGCGKSTDAELARFSDIALGSAKELENHLIFARDLDLIDAATHAMLESQVDEVRRMLFSFSKSVRSRAAPRPRKKRPPRTE